MPFVRIQILHHWFMANIPALILSIRDLLRDLQPYLTAVRDILICVRHAGEEEEEIEIPNAISEREIETSSDSSCSSTAEE